MGNTIALQSLVESHEQPFVVIDSNFTVVAVNNAFEKSHHLRREQVIGRSCYKVCHDRPRPCFEMGEECPMARIRDTLKPVACMHSHFNNGDGRGGRWVQINAYPIQCDNDAVYLGESMKELGVNADAGDRKVSMVGRSFAFRQMLRQLYLAAKSAVPVVLLGETGTGKELAAKFIHEHSERRHKPFLTVDCTVLTETLFESELFGHEHGAFTGSAGRKHGLLELVGGGTLFLDEIAEVPLAMQAKLLRVLDSGEFRRVGGHRTLTTDARIICATNSNLWDEVQARRFRDDLYYRIACMCIQLPNLAERRDDIPFLAQALLERIGPALRRENRLTTAALEHLKARNFPGNIRELRNILYAAAAHAPESIIDVAQLERFSHHKNGAADGASASVVEHPAIPFQNNRKLTQAMHDVEARYIGGLLDHHQGNRRKVAGELAISERTLYRKLKRYGLSGSI